MKSKNFIPLASPNIGAKEIQSVIQVLESGMLVQGEKVKQLELKTAEYLGGNQVVASSNGTSTMHLALLAEGIGPGDEVIVPAFSYVATANVVELVGATPIFVDIEIDSFNINASLIEEKITPNTKAIIPVHEFGLPCKIDQIKSIAEENNLFLLEDAACALGAKYNGQYVGTIGDVGSFSLHPRKAITSGEGGLLHCNNDDFAQKIRTLRNHGIEVINGKVEFTEAGLNYRLTDMQAALVNPQLEKLNKILERRNELASVYSKEINSPLIKTPIYSENVEHSWQTYHIILNKKLNRSKVINDLNSKGIGSNYGAQCIPALKYYQNKYQLNIKEKFPNAYKAFNQGLAIPLYEKLNEEDILYIADHLNKLK